MTEDFSKTFDRRLSLSHLSADGTFDALGSPLDQASHMDSYAYSLPSSSHHHPPTIISPPDEKEIHSTALQKKMIEVLKKAGFSDEELSKVFNHFALLPQDLMKGEWAPKRLQINRWSCLKPTQIRSWRPFRISIPLFEEDSLPFDAKHVSWVLFKSQWRQFSGRIPVIQWDENTDDHLPGVVWSSLSAQISSYQKPSKTDFIPLVLMQENEMKQNKCSSCADNGVHLHVAYYWEEKSFYYDSKKASQHRRSEQQNESKRSNQPKRQHPEASFDTRPPWISATHAQQFLSIVVQDPRADSRGYGYPVYRFRAKFWISGSSSSVLFRIAGTARSLERESGLPPSEPISEQAIQTSISNEPA